MEEIEKILIENAKEYYLNGIEAEKRNNTIVL